MSTSSSVTQLVSRIDQLIARGEGLRRDIKIEQKVQSHLSLSAQILKEPPKVTRHEVESGDGAAFLAWRTNVVTVLSVYARTSPNHESLVSQVAALTFGRSGYDVGCAMLRAFKDDLLSGALASLESQVESRVANDFLDESQKWLSESGVKNSAAGLSAALTGAVLEHLLRYLCQSATPPIAIQEPSGAPSKATTLVDRLYAQKAISDSDAKSVRAWCSLRNKAAHGNFSSVSDDEARLMIQGTRMLYGKYLV